MSRSRLYAIYFDLGSYGKRLRVLLSNACREEAVFVRSIILDSTENLYICKVYPDLLYACN